MAALHVGGRVVVVTGAARGIGQALAKAFLSHGARVVAIDRHWAADDGWSAELDAGGALRLSAQITDDTALNAAFAAVLARFGQVDVLVNNAAMRQRDLYPVAGACAVLDTEDEHWERMFRVNVVGTLKVTRRFVRPMIAAGRGQVVMVSANGSLTLPVAPGVSEGHHPHLLNQPYDATKAALTSMAFYLAEELRPAGVAVNTVFPGATRTTGSDELTPGREALGLRMALLDAAHVVPLVLELAQADARHPGGTGRAYDAVPWNAARAVSA